MQWLTSYLTTYVSKTHVYDELCGKVYECTFYIKYLWNYAGIFGIIYICVGRQFDFCHTVIQI